MDTGDVAALIAVTVSLASLAVTSALAIWVRSEASKDEKERKAEVRRLHSATLANEWMSEAVRALGRLRIGLIIPANHASDREKVIATLQDFSSHAYYFRALPKDSPAARKLFDTLALANLLSANLWVSAHLSDWGQEIEFLQTELGESAAELDALISNDAFAEFGYPGLQVPVSPLIRSEAAIRRLAEAAAQRAKSNESISTDDTDVPQNS